MPTRAIALAGGGPAAGLHIGVLEALHDNGITFRDKGDVWALSCIGAWVGIIFNQADSGKEIEQTYEFFKNAVFRDDETYRGFPVNSVFGPDWFAVNRAVFEYFSKKENIENIWIPHKIMDAVNRTMSRLIDDTNLKIDRKDKYNLTDFIELFQQQVERQAPLGGYLRRWDKGDINQWLLNDVLAVNPFVRAMASATYLSNMTGLSRLYYPDSEFMKKIRFDRLNSNGKPHILHNAWNLSKQRLELFSNRAMRNVDEVVYKGPISAASLCACSALPFVEETVKIDNDIYCEGALIDTVNFKNLLVEHPNIDEIWVSRIVDAKQIRAPKNLHDALANLCQLFAATVGEDDVELFKYHIQYDKLPNGKKWTGTLVEIRVGSRINFEWNHTNLDVGREDGYQAAMEAIRAYRAAGPAQDLDQVRIINSSKSDLNLDRLAKSIARAKGQANYLPYRELMTSRVDQAGDVVSANDDGTFPDGSEPFSTYVYRIPMVREIYDHFDDIQKLEKISGAADRNPVNKPGLKVRKTKRK